MKTEELGTKMGILLQKLLILSMTISVILKK